jgi:signal transduction histidine kinase/CheY-like chemotaxis protein
MGKIEDIQQEFLLRTEILEEKLREAMETLDAIRCGDVDAVVVTGRNGHKVYTLENADKPYRILIEKMQEGAVTLSDDGLVLYCNQALGLMLNKSVQHIIGASFQQFVPESELPVFQRLLIEAGKGEILLKASEDKTVQTHLSFSVLPDEEGRILCGVVTDLSLHKLRMNELAEKNQQLQKEISERERTEETLRQAQKMEAVGQLTGGLAHDFNNLLTVILGNLQLISAKTDNDERLARYIKSAIGATERGANLTQKLLAFSRRQALRAEAVLVNDLLPGIQMLARQIIGVNIDLNLKSGENLWFCRTDAIQLESAVLNLVINARDAMPQGGQLTIETANITFDEEMASAIPDAIPGQYVTISVKDTGTGIPDEVLKRVFEPFFTTKAIGKGSGLGLSMVYGFVRQTNGFITIDSQANQGTKVCLYLPFTEASAVTCNKLVLPISQQQAPQASILVVEDDIEVIKIVKELLTDIGYNVLSSPSAPEALRVLEQQKVDLIFSDVVMPGGMSGIDMARLLHEERPDLPVLLTSGFISQSMDYNEQMDTEFNILKKPYHRNDLAEAIRETLIRKLEKEKGSVNN